MDRTSRIILAVCWLTLCAVVGLNVWQVRQADQRATEAFCYAIDSRVSIEKSILELLVVQGTYSEDEAGAELDREAAVLRQVCPGYTSPTPEGAP